ncbi:MAG: helix-turn-helix domain-containing protein [Pseudonocardiales bacterium]|nr:helix-turn-helix domain-containing protein [Pseudonocardiales bacterium]
MTAQRDRDLYRGQIPAHWQGKPTVLRIAVGSKLRRLREASGVTRDAAGYVIRASSSKISRLELGRVSFKERDVADLLTLYGITDAQEREAFLALVRQANAPGWWQEYGDVLPNWFETYLGLEQAASMIRTYEPALVPGLLQTEDYARAVIQRRHVQASASDVGRRIALRIARQEFLTQAGAPYLWVALDESALRRPLGSPAVQRAQLRHLIEMAQRPNIKLQVVPLQVGGPVAVGSPFTILRFSEPGLPDVVYLEHLDSALYLDKERDTVSYLALMDSLCVEAESPDASISFLRRIIESLPSNP